MRKAVTLFLILAILCGGFYYCLQMGYIDRWFPGVMEKVIPGYKSTVAKDTGRVSSTDANAVFVDSIKVIADLGSGTGQIPRFAGSVEPQETREYKLEGERKVKKCFVKEGDIVKINFSRFAKAKHTPGAVDEAANKQFDNLSWDYEIPVIIIEDTEYLFIQDRDIEYVVEEYEVDEGGLLQ